MRTFVFALGFALAGTVAFGQARTDPNRSSSPDVTLPKYKVTRTNGQVYYFVDYTKKSPWYIFTTTRGTKASHLIDSVAKVEEIPEPQIKEIEKKVDAGLPISSDEPKARTTPRVEARTTARTEPPTGRMPDFPPLLGSTGHTRLGSGGGTSSSSSSSSTHVGPRGGIYHYSASGNKVYHSRKK